MTTEVERMLARAERFREIGLAPSPLEVPREPPEELPVVPPLELPTALERLYPEMFDPEVSYGFSPEEIPEMVYQSVTGWASEDPEGFIADLYGRGELEDRMTLLEGFGLDEPTVEELLAAPKPFEIPEEGYEFPVEVEEAVTPYIREFEEDGVMVRRLAETTPIRKLAVLKPDYTVWMEDKQVGTYSPETGEVTLIEVPAVEVAKLGLEEAWKEYMAAGRFSWAGGGRIALAALGVGGSYVEKYIGRPWETAILEARARFQLVNPLDVTDELNRVALDRLAEARDKYGWAGALISEDVDDIWGDYLEETYGPAKPALNIVEWLNPAYIIPIGHGFGMASRFASKIPVIGKAVRATAGGVQYVRAHTTLKLATYTAKGVGRVGERIGEAAANRLIKQSRHLEVLMELPTNEKLIEGVLIDNWMKRTLTIAAKVPAIRKGIEKSLGWRILVKRQSKGVEDIVGRAGVIHNEIMRRGPNAKAIKVWELREISGDPVKLFGFNKKAFAPKIRKLVKEADGTLEDIFTHPERYALNEKQLRYVTRVHEINTEILNFLKKEGVAPERVGQDWWIHRVVEGKFDSTGELIMVRGRPGVRAGRIGTKPSFELHRKAPTMAEGIEWGVIYGRNPEQYISTYIEEAFKKVADARVVKYLEPFGVKPTEILAKQYPELVGKALLTQTELADAAKFHSIINRAIRGEKIPTLTLRAMEKRFPQMGKRLRAVIEGKPMPRVALAETTPKGAFGYPQPVGGRIITKAEWAGMSVPERATLVKGYGLSGKVGSKSWKALTAEEKAILLKLETVKPEIVGIRGFKAKTTIKKVTVKPTSSKLELEALRKEVKALTEARKAPYWQARTEKALRMEQIRQPGIEEGYIMHPFAGGRIYDREFIDAFNKFFGHEKGLGVLRVTSDVAGILRITKAALDLSAMAIQGLPSFGLAHSYLVTNPKIGAKLIGGWYKTFLQSSRAFFNPDILAAYMVKNKKLMSQMISLGSSARSVDYFAALGARRGIGGLGEAAMRKIPLKPYHRAETAFFGAGQMIRTEFARILLPKAIKMGREIELMRILDRMTGIIDPSALGVPLTVRQLEQSVVWFAPSYTRACLTVLSDVFRGGMTGEMARRALGGLISTGAIYYSGVQYAVSTIEGKDNEQAWDAVREGFCIYDDPITGETEWKPSGRFMTLKVGNYNFGVGGFWYGLLRLSGNILATINEVGERERIDLVRILKHGSFNKRDNPFIYWWYSRASTLMGVGYEFATGKEFLGYDISPEGLPVWEDPMAYALWFMKKFEPIWMEQGINPFIPGLARESEIPEGAARKAVIPAEILGLRTFPEGQWVKFYDKVEDYINRIPEEELDEKQKEPLEEGKLEWRHLTQLQKMNLLSRYPDLLEFYEEAQADSQVRQSPHWEAFTEAQEANRTTYYERGDELVERVALGDIDTRELREKWGDAGLNYGAHLDEMERSGSYEAVYDYFDKIQGERAEKYGFVADLALAEYIDILFADYTDEKGDYDWRARDDAIDELIDKWGVDYYEAIRQMYAQKRLLKDMNPTLIRLSDDKDKLGRGYWRLPYKPINEMDEEDEDEGNIPAEYHTLWKQYQATLDKGKFIEAHPELAKDWRAEYRLNNPQDDARLALWGYGGKLQTKEAYDLTVKWGQELGIPLEQMGLGLPPHSLVDDYFELNRIVTETSGGSVEARLFKLEHPNYLAWGVENWGWSDLSDENMEVLRLRFKWQGKEDTPEAKDDMRRIQMYQFNAPIGIIEDYVEYGRVIDEFNANSVEAKLFKIDHPEFFKFGQSEDTFGWDDLSDENIDVLRITVQMRGIDEETATYKKLNYRKQAYQIEFPEKLIDTYIDWYMVERKGYEDDWFLMEHQDFYKAMLNKGVFTERKDFRQVPSREVYALLQVYDELPTVGRDRLIFRHENPDLENWLVDVKGYTPVGDRWKEPEPPKITPTVEFREEVAEREKEFEEILKEIERKIKELT